MTTNRAMINEWDVLDNLMVSRDESACVLLEGQNSDSIEKQIRQHLREIMVRADLEELTAYDVSCIYNHICCKYKSRNALLPPTLAF